MQGVDTTNTTADTITSSTMSSSEAAELVLRERQRQREATQAVSKRSSSRRDNNKSSSGCIINGSTSNNKHDNDNDEIHVELETVSIPKWDGIDQGDVDESELDRRQRVLSQQLERRQREMLEQSEKLARVREELKALEQPIKADIMGLREKLEQANREEIGLVQGVNMMRKELAVKEKSLTMVRKNKQEFADELIKVMADYERRKTERLNEIASLVGGVTEEKEDGSGGGGKKRAGGLVKGSGSNRSSSKSATFSGF